MGSGSGTHDLGPLGAEPIASGMGRSVLRRPQAASDAAGAPARCRLSDAVPPRSDPLAPHQHRQSSMGPSAVLRMASMRDVSSSTGAPWLGQ